MGSRLWQTGAMTLLSLLLPLIWLESCLCRSIEIIELLVHSENKKDENAAERPEKKVIKMSVYRKRLIEITLFSQKCALRTLIQLSRFFS